MATNLGTAYVQIMPTTKGISSSISKELSGGMSSAGNDAGSSFGGSLVGTLKKVVAAAGIGTIIKNTLEAGANLQQSFGGLETLYGDAAGAAKQYAAEAAAAGISMNDYAEQAVSFGAALTKAYEGVDGIIDPQAAAAQAANQAIMDMADNSAKMGTDLSSIQTAYQGFAKQNYTMLDNLKLGYGGTKSEMERLLSDAESLTGVHYDIDNLGDVYSAIHAIQEDLGLTGVAAEEAQTTMSGSMGAMKAAAENLMANLALGEDIGPSLSTLMSSVGTFLTKNLLPMVGNILSELPSLLGDALLFAFDNIPGMIDGVINFINNLTSGMEENGGEFQTKMQEIGQKAMDMIKEIDWAGLGSSLLDLIITGATTFGPILWEGLKSIAQTAMDWFKEVDWLQVGSDVLNFIIEGAQIIGPALWDGLKAIASTAIEWFKEVDWLQLGSDVLNLVIDGLVAIGSFLWDTLKSIGTDAIEKFKEIDWLELGSNIIDGIVNGLDSAGQAIIDTLTGWATKAWESIKEFFAIGSPSKLMRDTIGKMIPLGIAEGIDAEGDALGESLDSIAKDAVDGFEMPINLGLPQRAELAGNNSVTDNTQNTFNIYTQPGMNVNEVADAVQRRLAQERQQRRAVWGYAY